VDLVVLTHPHADHVTGLIDVIESYEVDLILHPGTDHPSDIFEAWSDVLEASDAEVVVPPPDTRIQLGGEVYLDVLHAGLPAWSKDSNDGSIVLRLGYKDVSFLLTGDINSATELELMRSGRQLRSTVLKVPHHGSNGSSASEFLLTVDPAISVITVGDRNPFGHPHKDALDRIKKSTHTDQVFLTTERGNVTIDTDGSEVWVSTAR
jgi:beta-lactamase superfamily II metal-dependent hydrolase